MYFHRIYIYIYIIYIYIYICVCIYIYIYIYIYMCVVWVLWQGGTTATRSLRHSVRLGLKDSGFNSSRARYYRLKSEGVV